MSELVDFDESHRLVAFYLPDEHAIGVYKFLPEMNELRHCKQLDLSSRFGDAKLTNICFVPQKEKLVFIDEGNHCHMLEIRNKNVIAKSHDPLKIEVPIDKVTISHEGTFLLVISSHHTPEAEATAGSDLAGELQNSSKLSFSSTSEPAKQHEENDAAIGDPGQGSEQALPESRSQGRQQEEVTVQEDCAQKSPATLCQGEYAALHVYSLTTFKKLKEINLKDYRLSVDLLASAQIAIVGKHAHLVYLNPEHSHLQSLCVDVQSNENMLILRDLDNASESSASAKDQADKMNDQKPSSCLDYVYHIFDKFCTEDCLQTSRQDIRLLCVLPDAAVEKSMCDEKDCARHVQMMKDKLSRETHKPMNNFDIRVRSLPLSKCSWRHLSVESSSPLAPELRDWLKRVACLVPIQIARAEDNKLTPFSNGMKNEEVAGSKVSVADLEDAIEFGLYEQILDSWPGPVKVVSSMGKQSTGKSYMLNHLTGSMFDISGTRCTDGVWMTLRITSDCLYVVLDFEGLGSLERSPQEDMLLSILNAAISGLTLFKTEFRVDQDTRDMFKRFRDGVEYIKGDPVFYVAGSTSLSKMLSLEISMICMPNSLRSWRQSAKRTRATS